MANVDKRNGFQLIISGGRQPRRVRRTVAADNPTIIAPGDAYIIHTDGTARRCTATNVAVIGIVEAIELIGVDQGPVSRSYLPINTAAAIIGIEDSDAEFAVTATVALTLDDYIAGALVDLVDTAPDTTLSISRQAIGDRGGDQFKLIRAVDSPSNDDFAILATVVVKLLPASVI